VDALVEVRRMMKSEDEYPELYTIIIEYVGEDGDWVRLRRGDQLLFEGHNIGTREFVNVARNLGFKVEERFGVPE